MVIWLLAHRALFHRGERRKQRPSITEKIVGTKRGHLGCFLGGVGYDVRDGPSVVIGQIDRDSGEIHRGPSLPGEDDELHEKGTEGDEWVADKERGADLHATQRASTA